jgi:3-oxoacyl-[acyl-carrier protein] reductase
MPWRSSTLCGPDMSDTDRPVHLILGASGGIGSALARRLAAGGAALVLAAPESERLTALAAELGAEARPLDARGFDAVTECARAALEAHGRLDGIACLVGSILLKPAHTTGEQELRETLEQNLLPAFAAVAAAGKLLRKSGGSIVLMSSAAATTGLANHEAIAAAKAAVIGLARSAAATYAQSRIRVNVVAPGLVRTPLSERITSNPASLAASESLHPLGRIGTPADVASAIAFLLDSEQSWITGQVLGVDGGLATLRAR